jgi:hypothetical protein
VRGGTRRLQALDRTAPSLPILPTTPARRTHDQVPSGATSLFAASAVASGTVISQCTAAIATRSA